MGCSCRDVYDQWWIYLPILSIPSSISLWSWRSLYYIHILCFPVTSPSSWCARWSQWTISAVSSIIIAILISPSINSISSISSDKIWQCPLPSSGLFLSPFFFSESSFTDTHTLSWWSLWWGGGW